MIDKIEISALKDYLETNDESEPKIARGFLEDVVLMFEETNQYRAIGTVEECREARERQRSKKPIKDECNHDCCPNCGWIVYQDEYGGRYLPHCENCGQAISWDEEEKCQ